MRRGLLVVVLVLAVLACLPLAWRAGRRAPAMLVAAPDTVAGSGVQAVRLYFGAADGSRLVWESRELIRLDDLHARVARLVAELDAGPRQGGVAVLPPGTALRQVFLDADGLLTVDLSGSFRLGFRGGAAAEYLAVASLARTLAHEVPEAKRLQFLCVGSTLATLGGHLPLDQPLDLEEWR